MAEEPTDKSKNAVLASVASFQEQDGEMRNLLGAMKDDFLVERGIVHTGWNDAMYGGRMLTWSEFCEFHGMNGDRFMYALEALMELRTPAMVRDEQMTLRTFGGDNMVLKVDRLMGGGESTFETALQLWVRCAMFLGRHPEHPVPARMRP